MIKLLPSPGSMFAVVPLLCMYAASVSAMDTVPASTEGMIVCQNTIKPTPPDFQSTPPILDAEPTPSGLEAQLTSSQCAKCNGSGRVRFDVPRARYMGQCPECDGSGKITQPSHACSDVTKPIPLDDLITSRRAPSPILSELMSQLPVTPSELEHRSTSAELKPQLPRTSSTAPPKAREVLPKARKASPPFACSVCHGRTVCSSAKQLQEHLAAHNRDAARETRAKRQGCAPSRECCERNTRKSKQAPIFLD